MLEKTLRVHSMKFQWMYEGSCKRQFVTLVLKWQKFVLDLTHLPLVSYIWVSGSGACPTKYRIDQIRSNSNFAWNSYHCAFEDSRPIITKFGTRQDSRTVVRCTKFRYDRPTIIEIRGTRIFSKFWIWSNLSIRYLVGQAPGQHWFR